VADAGGSWSVRPARPRGRRAAAHPARASRSLDAEPGSTAAWSRGGRGGAHQLVVEGPSYRARLAPKNREAPIEQ